MASGSSSSSQILCASFNQDNNLFSISTKNGFKIFDSQTGRLCYQKGDLGGLNVVEMLFTSSLLAIVGTGEQPSLSPRHLFLFDKNKERALRERSFMTSILAVRLNKKRFIVVLQDTTFIYDLDSLNKLEEMDTVPNKKGLCAFAPKSEGCYLALPASDTKGSVLVYNTLDLQSVCQIDAHHSPLAALVFSSNGMYLATASEKGTMIRVFLVTQATKSYSFRRGTQPSTIYSLAFGPSLDLPDILVATSSSGSLHTFFLDPSMNGRGHPKLLGSAIPHTVNDALDPASHQVIHNVVPAGVKSCVTVYTIENVESGSTHPDLRATIHVITYNGFFREYALLISKSNESLWSLERELNLLDSAHASARTNT